MILLALPFPSSKEDKEVLPTQLRARERMEKRQEKKQMGRSEWLFGFPCLTSTSTSPSFPFSLSGIFLAPQGDLPRMNFDTRERILALTEFIREYHWLSEMYFVDFYSQNLPGRFPPEWVQAFMVDKTVTQADLQDYILTRKPKVELLLQYSDPPCWAEIQPPIRNSGPLACLPEGFSPPCHHPQSPPRP